MIDFKIIELDNYYDSFNVYKLFEQNKDAIFLDSSKEDKHLSKYSFIGINPYIRFLSKGNEVIIDDNIYKDVDPFDKLEELLNKYKLEYESDIPFISGAIGYFSYDIGRMLEELPDTSKELISLPDSIFVFFDNLIIFDLQNKKTYITGYGQLKESKKSIEDIKNKIIDDYKDVNENHIKSDNINYNKFYSNFNKEEYEESINKLKSYIKEGHVYVANMTRAIWCENNEDPFNIYKKLRSVNKAPFSAYMNFGDFQIISSSPERFLSIKDRKVETRPIKGTRPRGADKAEDDKNRNELINSEKDKSELLMIVDLERNDLSKVCKPKSVNVTEMFKIEEYATVFHLVCTIEGILKDDTSAVKCIKECFPGGSITGAPKIRAMEIIEELEKVKRNIYTGSIGYFDLRGNSDFNIVIRTIVKQGNKCCLGVGGGITYESIESEEWFETIDKAKALMGVL